VFGVFGATGKNRGWVGVLFLWCAVDFEACEASTLIFDRGLQFATSYRTRERAGSGRWEGGEIESERERERVRGEEGGRGTGEREKR
jgi:hypothetical protein